MRDDAWLALRLGKQNFCIMHIATSSFAGGALDGYCETNQDDSALFLIFYIISSLGTSLVHASPFRKVTKALYRFAIYTFNTYTGKRKS